ncbi:MAG: hypothetical protein ACOZAA_14900 [Pseudomonadota bacterium]
MKSRPQTSFGRAPQAQTPDERRLRLQLARRLQEKIANYERAARRLHVAGEDDAAALLAKAARNLRLITARV